MSNDVGNKELRDVKTTTFCLSYRDWYDLKQLARDNHVRVADYIRGIVVDALEEERERALQRLGTTGRTEQGKASEASGAVSS